MTLRTTRAGTRSIAREEIKRVKKSLEKVRRWEKKWVVLEESGLKVYRWVPKPVSAHANNFLPKISGFILWCLEGRARR